MCLFLLIFTGTVRAQDICQELQARYQICMEHKIKNPENTLDFDACNGLTPQGVCEGAGCYWWVNKSKCLPYITYSDIDLSGTVGINDFIYWKWESGRKCPTEPDIPGFYGAPVAKTGQVDYYVQYLDDGALQRGVEEPNPRFTVNGDLTVTDNLTGLIWFQDMQCWGQDTWANCINNCNGLASGTCGLDDGSSAGHWALPNLRQLQSLFDYGNSSPALPTGHPFDVRLDGIYWTSTTCDFATGDAFAVDIPNGLFTNRLKTLNGRTICVYDRAMTGPIVPQCTTSAQCTDTGDCCCIYDDTPFISRCDPREWCESMQQGCLP